MAIIKTLEITFRDSSKDLKNAFKRKYISFFLTFEQILGRNQEALSIEEWEKRGWCSLTLSLKYGSSGKAKTVAKSIA